MIVAAHPRLVDGLRVQHARRRRLLEAGARHVGWKLGEGIDEIDALTCGQPAIGYLTSATVAGHGSHHDVAGARELRAEAELLIEVARTGERPCAVVGAAIEFVDVARPPCEPEAIVANNVFHRAAVLGRARAGAVPAVACARLLVDDEVREIAPVTTDVDAVIARVSELLEAIGEPLRAGDLILAGSLAHAPVAAGERVAIEVDGIDHVRATLTDLPSGSRRANPSSTRHVRSVGG